jgi:hypothetical protein
MRMDGMREDEGSEDEEVVVVLVSKEERGFAQ